jgi:transposase
MRLESVSLDGLVPDDHPVRTVWAVTGALDLSAFYTGIRSVAGKAGRDATDPRLLVALWLHATTEGIGSARELARRSRESDPYKWLCGGVSLNHHTLSDFRVAHGEALDALFTQVLAKLCDQGLVKVYRISQDGTRVRACAGSKTFRRRGRLGILLGQATKHVASLRKQLEAPAFSGGLSAKQIAARKRAARERQARIEAAMAELPALEARQAERAKTVSKKDREAGKIKPPRVSTTDPQARVMKMPDGGYRPAVNVQLACDTQSRAIVGVAVTNEGVDTNQDEPMRRQVEERMGQTVEEHLVDGGYLKLENVETAAADEVRMYVPPKPPRNKALRGNEYEPRPDDSETIRQWRQRMGSEEGQTIYRQRASTVETVNADLKTHRGLGPLTVRGLDKALCIALWSALAYNLMHFSHAILS